MLGLRSGALLFQVPERGVHAVKVIPNCLRGDRIIVRIGCRFSEVSIPHPHDYRRIRNLVVRRARRAGLCAFTRHLAALIEEVLCPGADRDIGDKVKFVPQAVQLFLAFFVQDQFHQRRVIAEEAHHAVIPGAEEPTLII